MSYVNYMHLNKTVFPNTYNQAYANERIIEIPLALSHIKKTKQILEVGRVLTHYTTQTWNVVDKFEVGSDVINQDILDFHPKSRFDQIISISTVEHIGVDDTTNNPLLGVKAIEKMKTLLTKHGNLLITIPIGYNQSLDKYLFSHPTLFTTAYGMKRITPWNTWKQVPLEEIQNSRYGWPFNNANGLFVGEFTQR